MYIYCIRHGPAFQYSAGNRLPRRSIWYTDTTDLWYHKNTVITRIGTWSGVTGVTYVHPIILSAYTFYFTKGESIIMNIITLYTMAYNAIWHIALIRHCCAMCLYIAVTAYLLQRLHCTSYMCMFMLIMYVSCLYLVALIGLLPSHIQGGLAHFTHNAGTMYMPKVHYLRPCTLRQCTHITAASSLATFWNVLLLAYMYNIVHAMFHAHYY